MIIVEGCDGAGKTTLINRLSKTLKIPIHTRHADSVKGPIASLYNWARADVATWDYQRMAIYDRHPYISEYIYAGLMRGGVGEDFLSVEAQEDIETMHSKALVIFCIPQLETLERNLNNEPQMSGVAEQIDNLYWAYREAHIRWAGRKIFYDYEINSFDTLAFEVKAYLAGRNY